MTQALIKGYGEVSIVDDEGHRQSIGTANDITDVGLERLLSADTALRHKSTVFPYIILSQNLPTDKDVYTREELDAAGAVILNISINDYGQTLAFKQAYVDFLSATYRIPGESLTYDVISLAYTDGDKWYLCSRAKAIDPETFELRAFTIPGNVQVIVSYTLTLAFHSAEGIAKVDLSTTTSETTLSGEYTTEWNTTAKRYSRSTLLPYVPGSRKLQWQYFVNTTNATTNCRMMSPLFSFVFLISNNKTVSEGIAEIEFVRSQDAVESLGIELVAPTTVLETVGLDVVGNGDVYRLSLRAAPFTEVYILFENRLICTMYTDAAGYGTGLVNGYFYDNALQESRNVKDGVMFRAILINPLGRTEHDYIPMDTEANRLYHHYWSDNTTLHLINRLNDKIEVFINYGYVKSGQPLQKLKIAETTLTEPNTLYGVDGAVGTLQLNPTLDHNLLRTSKLSIRVTDAAGNVDEYYDTITPNLGSLNIPDVGKDRNNSNRYEKTERAGDPIFCIPLITKGSLT